MTFLPHNLVLLASKSAPLSDGPDIDTGDDDPIDEWGEIIEDEEDRT